MFPPQFARSTMWAGQMCCRKIHTHYAYVCCTKQMTGHSIATPYTPAVLVTSCSLHDASKAGGEAYLVVDEGPGVRHSGIIHFGPGMVAHPGSPESVAGDIHGLQAGAVPLNVKGSQVCQCSSQRVPCNRESRSQCM